MATPEYWPRLDRWVDENQSRAIDQLATLLRLPTVAHPTRENPALHECASLLVEMLTDIGAEDARIAGSGLHPIVLGSIGNDPTKPTLLLYGHFDVVDPGPLQLWETPPFEPSIRDGRLFARGSADNKGQFLSYLVALQALTECGVELPVNIKFVFDGAEEIGSPSLDRLRVDNPEAMATDLVFCADGPVHESGRPKIVLGSRGVVYLEIRVRTLRRASHSQYAAVLPNAAWRVVEILQSLKDAEGRIAVAGFYDEVVTPEPVDLELLKKIPCAREELTVEFAPSIPLPPCTDGAFNYRLLMEPVINITGISIGDPAGYVTVVPDEAVITMDIGLVPNQTPEDITEKIRKHLGELGIGREDISVVFVADPTRTPPNHPFVRPMADALALGWGEEPVLVNRFGGYSGHHHHWNKLGIYSISASYGQPDQSNHAPNENLRLDNFRKGILATAEIIEAVGRAASADEIRDSIGMKATPVSTGV